MAGRRSSKKKTGSMAGLWKKSKEKAKENNFTDAIVSEVGNYRMQIVGAEIGDYGDERKIMLKWVVIDDDDCEGQINTCWEGIETEERLIWLQRMLIGLGVDIDDIDPEEEEDLLEVFNELIEEQVCAKVQIKEKDGYINMRVGKAIEIDDDLLLDPDEALGKKKSKKSSSKRGSKKDEQKEEESLEDELEKMSKAELKKYVIEEELDFKVTRKMDEDTIIDGILDELEAQEK